MAIVVCETDRPRCSQRVCVQCRLTDPQDLTPANPNRHLSAWRDLITPANIPPHLDAAVGARIGRVQLATNSTYRVSGINKYFNFDPTTGWVTLRETIDREQLPEDVVELLLIASPPSLIHVLITVLDVNDNSPTFPVNFQLPEDVVELLLIASPPSLIHVLITVLDVNDNSPTFPVNFQNVSIIESSPVGTRISLLPATDRDRGLNGTVIEYGIDGDSDQFQVVSPSPELLYLETKQPLDRESRQFVVLNLTAKDGGQPPRLGSTTVYVEIVDVNDNAPTFNATELEARWSGQASAAIVTLTATDADRGPNGQVIYSVYGPEAEQFVVKGDQVFAKTDNPTCCSSPPCTVCFITVRATDRGVPPLESTVLLKVLLSNENLHDPVINIRLHPSTVNFALIDAGAVAGRTVAVLTVTDEDGPISDSADITKSEFDLTFIASDGQLPQRTTNASLKVYNEAKLTSVPVAVERELAVSLPENSAVGSFVAQVHTNSSRCRFELRAQHQLFQVDRKSGIITTVSPLSVQLADSHVLEVLVQLPPPNIHTVTATVTVTVVDVNDHRPSIVELPDRLSISEDTAVGTVVLAVSARDEDRGDNALLSYRLLNGEATEYLSIGSNSGKIIMKKAVDFEKITEFDAEIEVCDHGRPRLCDVAILPIAIQDVNDNSPAFFCSESYSVLPMNSPPGTIVTVVLAKDRDSGSAGEVHYALLDSITDFSIDRSSGVVRTTAHLRPKSYKIRIGATDGHGVMSSNNVTVTLYVTTNESLIWKSGPETISLDDTVLPGDELARYETENADIGTVVGFLEAEDEDSGLNGVLGYRLLDNHHLIQLGVVSGKISSATIFDAEKTERIDFKYEVYDHGFPSKAVICNASVEITDLNDNIHTFDQGVYTVKVEANDPSENRTIITVHANDEDRTSKIVYRLLNYLHMFEIDANSGVVSRIGRLRPDSRFNISIGAVDEDGLISTAILIVTTSSDENAVPVFDKKEPFRISSSTALGSVIGPVRAVAGRHVIRYHLSDDRFDIDSWGNVILTDELTKPGTYEFIVTAATAHRNSSSVQKVVVIDAGDGGVGGMTFRVKENTAPDMITELDDDFELLLTVPFSSAFKFVAKKLIVARPLDAEVSSIYHILVGNKK
ncbi:unnamed protein product [Nippostrongylus brasiliensis]|uniref:Cadherin-3 (inferred by orthology to a C. elegans protein) n=1 Tax=Nippostrongylus brasiliensis TaxID=27835 RepID=A0A0N4YGV6_NIPBR|nr:unnamed protein product [Nippostrongylus brasiliensis]